MRPWQLILAMEVDASDGYRLCSPGFLCWKDDFNPSVREITRCRRRGRSSDCPSLSLFARSKAFWLQAAPPCKTQPHWRRDWVAGRLLSRQPALRHPPCESSASKWLCHHQSCYQFSRLLQLGHARFDPIAGLKRPSVKPWCCVSLDQGPSMYLGTSWRWLGSGVLAWPSLWSVRQ
jgi:hypothetical protein